MIWLLLGAIIGGLTAGPLGVIAGLIITYLIFAVLNGLV